MTPLSRHGQPPDAGSLVSRWTRAGYRATNRFVSRSPWPVAIDITEVLVAACDPGVIGAASRWGGAGTRPAVRCVAADELKTVASEAALELKGAALAAVETGSAQCFMAFDGATPVAHDFVALGCIDPSLNSGGSAFTGIGIGLPPSAAYVFKAWVASSWRGRGLHAYLVAQVADTLASQGIEWLVTTADWVNTASLRSFTGMGFVTHGRAAELVLARRHLYRVPPPIGLGAAQIRMHRPGAPPV